MRTTSPERTCDSTSASTDSATGGAISTPRFLHPGSQTCCPDAGDVQSFEPVELLLDRVQVEQRLRRMLMLPVAGIDDVRIGDACDELRRADLRMPDDDDVRVVRAERLRGVLQRFALVHRRA